MTVTGGRTVYELRGISCLPLELMEPTRKWIAVTRSFSAPVTSWQAMREAIASYAGRAAEKMRRYRVAAENIFVFMHTNTFNNARFLETTNDSGEVVALAVRLGERRERDGFRYSKCGVIITELMPETIRQPALWGELDREKRERAWKAMDKVNATWGVMPSAASVPVQGTPPRCLEQSTARLDGPHDGMNCLKHAPDDCVLTVPPVIPFSCANRLRYVVVENRTPLR